MLAEDRLVVLSVVVQSPSGETKKVRLPLDFVPSKMTSAHSSDTLIDWVERGISLGSRCQKNYSCALHCDNGGDFVLHVVSIRSVSTQPGYLDKRQQRNLFQSARSGVHRKAAQFVRECVERRLMHTRTLDQTGANRFGSRGPGLL